MRFPGLLTVFFWAIALPLYGQSLPQENPKLRTAGKVFDELVRAFGDGRTRPALRLLAAGTPGARQVAWFDSRTNTITIEERAYDLCAALGADSLDALAALLSHELAHYYLDHSWLADFGHGFADLEVGQRLKALEQHRDKLIEVETEADYFGGFFGYVAGYNTLDIAEKILQRVYAEYGLEDYLPGYPSLEDRGKIARRSREKVRLMIPVFEGGRSLMVIGEYREAARCFDYLARTFPSREILNNAGVARALEALELFAAGEMRFFYPLELDARTRLRRQRSTPGADSAVRRARLLEDARASLEVARHKDPGYAPAYINLACVADLQGNADQALLYAEEALKIAEKNGDPLSRANALIARGIARMHRSAAAEKAARGDFALAAEGNADLAALNLAALDPGRSLSTAEEQVRKPEKETYRSEQVFGPGTAEYDAITTEPDIVVPVPVADSSRRDMIVFSRQFAAWQGLVIDTGSCTISLLETREEHAGSTGRGIEIGHGTERVTRAYGRPDRLIAGSQCTYRVYEDPHLVFCSTPDDRVQGWMVYDIETSYYESPGTAATAAKERLLGWVPEPSRSGDSIHAEIAGMHTEPRLALVIGNGAYEEVPLRNAANDATAMARALRVCGFQVIQEIDADRKTMRRAIRDFGRRLRQGGVGLFYFAGHGLQVEGRNYLVPTSSDMAHEDEVEDECVPVSSIVGKMESADNRVNIIVLDACRNNPFAGRFRSQQGGLAGMMAATGSLIAYATAPGRVAADGDKGHGLYTERLLKYLQVPGLKLLDLFVHVRREVMAVSDGAQVPWEAHSLTGDFYFVLPREYASGILPFAPAAARASGFERGDMVYVASSGIYIDTYEIDNAEYATFLNAAGNQTEGGVSWLDAGDEDALIERRSTGYGSRPGYERHPVVEVTWYGARAYCEWAGKRLPTSEEWTRAYRGREEHAYAWGNAPPEVHGLYRANYDQRQPAADGYERTAPVGSFPAGATPEGVFDLAGNVWEWVDAVNGNKERRLLGGSWFNDASYLYPTYEYWSDPSLSFDYAGFRCACDP